MTEIFNGIINALVSVLPHDPFTSFFDSFALKFGSFLSFINCFIDFGFIGTVLLAWIGAVTAFYLYRAIASYLHLIA